MRTSLLALAIVAGCSDREPAKQPAAGATSAPSKTPPAPKANVPQLGCDAIPQPVLDRHFGGGSAAGDGKPVASMGNSLANCMFKKSSVMLACGSDYDSPEDVEQLRDFSGRTSKGATFESISDIGRGGFALTNPGGQGGSVSVLHRTGPCIIQVTGASPVAELRAAAGDVEAALKL